MHLQLPLCTKSVAALSCPICSCYSIKNGCTSAGRQRYRCKECGRSFLGEYQNNGSRPGYRQWIINLLKEGCGIRSIARLLRISITTVISGIRKAARETAKPVIPIGKHFEIDELRSFVKRKGRAVWVTYALCRESRRVVDFCVGARSRRSMNRVVSTVVMARPACVHTDRLPIYRLLVPAALHDRRPYGTNHIERMNVTLRSHLKRLGRRSIAFSKSRELLEACLRIYFWG